MDAGAGTGQQGQTHADLRQRDLQRSSLLRSVTHDLRTPLAAIRAVVSDLYSGVEYDEATRAELLQTVLDEIDRLDRVVANLLTASRIEAGAMEPRTTTVDVAELLNHRVRSLGALLRMNDLSVDVPASVPAAEADYGQIEQVVTNLLANAARYAPEGTAIVLSAYASVDGRSVRVTVADQGPGIPEEIAGTVFEPFVHGSGSRSTGLGLSISRSIVEAHGGSIGIDPNPAGGITVWFTLPVAQTFEVRRAGLGEA